MNRNLAITGITFACLAVAAGCQPAAGETGAQGPEAKPPALHVVLRWELVRDGKNVARENYAALEEACKASGHLVQGLTPDEVQKLGTGKEEIWQDARGAYGRQTTWKATVLEGSGCRVKLEETINEADRDYRDRDWSTMAIGPTDRAEEEAFARQQLGFERVGTGQVKGQPCTRWRSKDHEDCVWSGGLDIGMGDGPADSLCLSSGPLAYLKTLPLESRHGPKGPGCHLELETMTVGKGLLPEVGRAMAELGAPAAGG